MDGGPWGWKGLPIGQLHSAWTCSFISNFTQVQCGTWSSCGVSVAGSRCLCVCVCVWGGVALTTKFRCPLVPSAPYPPPLLLPPVSLSARRWRFWFWIEGLSCRSGVRASHWRSWAFSWAGSAQRRRVERAPCTWPLRWEKKLLKFT